MLFFQFIFFLGNCCDLFSWLENNGGHINGVNFTEVPVYGRSLVAGQDLPEGTVIGKVPYSLMLDEKVINFALPDTLTQTLSPFELAAIFLSLESLEQDSKWKMYFECLPKMVDTPIFWDPKEMEQIQSPVMKQWVEKRVKTILSSFEHVSNLLNGYPIFDQNKYVWANVMLWSRSFTIPTPNNAYSAALCPFGDMFNYHPNFNVVSFADKNYESFIFKTIRDVKQGEQLFTDYGSGLDNHKLLYDYGFVLSHNPVEQFNLNCQMFFLKDDTLDMRIKMGEKAKLFGQQISLKESDIEVSEFIHLCGMLAIMPNPNKFFKRRQNYKKAMNKFKNQIYQHLRGLLNFLLSKYPTSLQQDYQILSKPIMMRYGKAVILRVGQKAILYHYLNNLLLTEEEKILRAAAQQEKNINNIEVDNTEMQPKVLEEKIVAQQQEKDDDTNKKETKINKAPPKINKKKKKRKKQEL